MGEQPNPWNHLQLQVAKSRHRVRIIVKLDRFNAPISKSAGVLGSYLGTLVKKPHLAPLNVLKWNDAIFKEIYHDRLLAAVTVQISHI